MRCMGLDIGDRKIGVALSDALGLVASPLLVIKRKDPSADIAAILDLVKQHQVQVIIVGIPFSMDGTVGPQASKVQNFAELLKKSSPVPVEYRDERLTTITARQLMEEASGKKYPRKAKIQDDAAAAAVILQSYLNELKPLEYPPEDGEQL
ncbi:MAG: Holliday junction resolvase RuvX [Dehalococcoidales bacterium]|nr:Holliday junction resolvase RuvX [Dehalococcoidales bacterium]